MLSIRRAARSIAWHGTVVLTTCDNLSCALAHEKRRAKDYGLRMTVCVGSAYSIACNTRWHHRYVISEVNPDDWGSREADRGVIDVGDKIVAEAAVQKSLDMLLPQRFEVEELPATKEGAEGWHRSRRVSRVGSGQVARQYVYKPPVQRPRTVLRLFDALGLCESPPGFGGRPCSRARG